MHLSEHQPFEIIFYKKNLTEIGGKEKNVQKIKGKIKSKRVE
jgi:hypothetical protein